MITQAAETVFEHSTGFRSKTGGHQVAVVIALYNYARYIEETLDSVAAQTMRDVTVVVVNDCSTDNSLEVAEKWMHRNRDCGMGLLLLSHEQNAGASIARNTGIASTGSVDGTGEPEFCFLLDADNLLYPRCIEKHVAALNARPDAAAAYSLIEVFEGDRDLFGAGVFTKEGLIHGNFIDLMALYRRSALTGLSGFEKIRHGWEDYDLWLRMLESGQTALHIPEITSRYRHHRASITRTEQHPANAGYLHAEITRRHPWLDLRGPPATTI